MASRTITLNRQRSGILLILAVFAMAFLITLAMDALPAGALGRIYFDDDGSGADCDVWDKPGNNAVCGSSEIRLIVGQTQYVRKTGTKLRAYFHNNRGQVTIENYNWCPGTAFGDAVETEDNDQGVAQGSAVTKINIPGTGDVFGRRYKAGDARCDNKVQVSLNGHLNDGTNIGLPGKWYADFSLEHVDQAAGYDGTQNAMSVQLSSGTGFTADSTNDWLVAPTGHIAYGGGGNFRGTGMTVDAKSSPTNYGLKVRFGTNCNITTAATYSITFYDLDGGDDGGAQKNGAIRLKLRRESPTGAVSWLVGGTNTWQAAEPAFADAKIAPSVANSDWDWDFVAHPDYQYQLQVLNIYQNNTIQLSTPFDNVYGVRACDRPNAYVRATTTADKADIEAGETVTFKGFIENHGTRTGYIDDAHRMVWKDNGDGVPGGAGDVQVVDSDLISGNTAVPTTPPAGETIDGLKISTYGIAGDANYPQICFRVHTVSPSPNGTGGVDTAVTRSQHTVCSKIAKYPGMVVRGGDIRTGGTVPGGVATCTLGTIPTVGLNEGYRVRGHYYRDAAASTPNKAYKGSYGAHGVVSLGTVSHFGSANEFYKGVGTPSSYILFGTQAWGSSEYGYGSEGFFAGTGNGVTGTTATHCLPDVWSLYKPTPTINLTLTASAYSATSSATYVFPAGGLKDLHICTAGNGTACTSTAGLTLAKGQKVTIRVTQPEDGYVDNDIIINGPINSPVAATTYANISELAQVVIIADKPINIKLKAITTGFAGLLATKGDIYTCEGFDGNPDTGPLSTATCPNQALTTNGAVILGGKLFPYRTEGFETKADGSVFAETFNLSSNLLLSDFWRSKQQSGLRVDYQTDLPSRF